MIYTVWGIPPATVWHFFMIPANNTPGDHLPFVVGFFFGLFAIVPVITTALITLVPGGIAAGIGAIMRTVKRHD
jgi:hypothetical protein